MRSPVESSMSSSRPSGSGETSCASAISESVVLPIAETVPTTRRPLRLGLDEALRDAAHLVGVGDGRPAELHHDGVEGDVAARGAAVSVLVTAATGQFRS